MCLCCSAKVLVPGEPNVSYICSRYYRAPELVFEATQYTTAIDVWSLGRPHTHTTAYQQPLVFFRSLHDSLRCSVR